MGSGGVSALVLQEIRSLRRAPGGVSVDSLVAAPTIVALLGSGDPRVAYTRLSHHILDSELGADVKAAAASLGFLADGDTHLQRLDTYGLEVGLEQRQVRRLSDRGTQLLAALIASNWAVESSPQLTALVFFDGATWQVQAMCRRLAVVEMRTPKLLLHVGHFTTEPSLDWVKSQHGVWVEARMGTPVQVADIGEETSLTVVWQGELWPKFDTQWHGPSPAVGTETLGNKLLLRLRREP